MNLGIQVKEKMSLTWGTLHYAMKENKNEDAMVLILTK